MNPDPFKNDEYRVLHYGEQINGAKGTCNSHGKIRSIKAWKFSIITNSSIVGLLGYFVDPGIVAAGTQNITAIHQDSVTGLLVFQYQSSWQKEHCEFALMYVQRLAKTVPSAD